MSAEVSGLTTRLEPNEFLRECRLAERKRLRLHENPWHESAFENPVFREEQIVELWSDGASFEFVLIADRKEDERGRHSMDSILQHCLTEVTQSVMFKIGERSPPG